MRFYYVLMVFAQIEDYHAQIISAKKEFQHKQYGDLQEDHRYDPHSEEEQESRYVSCKDYDYKKAEEDDVFLGVVLFLFFVRDFQCFQFNS